MILDDFQAQGRDWCGGGSSFAGKAVAAGRSGVPGRIGSTSHYCDSVQPHFSKKRHESNIAGFNILPKKSSNNSHFPCFINSSFIFPCFISPIPTFASLFRSRGVRRGGKGGGTGPGHCLMEAVIKRWDQSGGWDEVHGKSMEHLAFVEIRDYDN